MKRTDQAARGGTWKCNHSMAYAKPYGAHKCVTCSHWLSLGPSNDEPDCVKVEMRAAELAQDIERCGYTVLRQDSDEIRGWSCAEQNLREHSDAWQAGYLAAAIAAHDLTAPLDAGEGGR